MIGIAILNPRRPPVRYAWRAPPGPPKKATNATARPTARNATTKAATAMRAASYPSGTTTGVSALCGVGRLAARALPAAERGEDLAETGQVLVLRGPLLVVHHQQPLRASARVLGDLADRLADAVRRDLDPVVARLAGLLREHAGCGPAGARLGVRGLTGASGPDHQLAVGAAGGLRRPCARHVALHEQEAVRA